MPIHNNDIADIFNQVADLLEIQEANPFRVRAYRNAGRAVGGLARSAAEMVEKGEDLATIPGVGKDLAGKIETIVKTGKLPLLADLERELPGELAALMRIPGLGPKKVGLLYRKLGISSAQELKKAVEAKKLRELPGFGEKTEAHLLEELEKPGAASEVPGRFKLSVAEQIAEPLLHYLQKTEGVREAAIAGSYRRRRETVGDLDILVACKAGCKVMDRFVSYDDVVKVLAEGTTKSSVVLRGGLQVDVRVVPAASYGAALLYFTGSKAHNIAVRKIAVRKNLKINEYGAFRENRRVAGRTEKEVYATVGLPYIEPELREDRGEIEAALSKRLPRLVTLEDIRGDLHVHTKRTDGHFSTEQMAEAARERGYEYVAITDHSRHVTVARGMDVKRLAEEIREIDGLNKKMRGIRILKSIELDILENGSLDLPDEILEELDLVICSVHYKFNLPREKQTERIIRAMDNPRVNIFSHPSGRLINERPPYEVDMEKIITAARERGCHLELNAHPDRLDLNDVDARMAKEMGVKVAISTDAHRIDDLAFMRFGVGQARRGWLEEADVLNTRSWPELQKLLKR
ncbi:MAG: DNA polymerase/3'-5' exonuclease PolX [Acidobacteriota bacterium]